MQIVKKEYEISKELEYEILRFDIGHDYIKQKANLSEYFSESKKCTVQTIRFEFTMPLKIPRKEIMGNIDIHGHSLLSIIEHGYDLNGININVYKHDKKTVYVDILFIRNIYVR